MLPAPKIEPEELDNFYKSYGFRSPREADRNLQEIAGAETDRRNLARSIDLIFTAFGSAVDPDAAMSNLERYISEIRNRSEFFVRLAEDPSLVELLARIFGGSSFLTGILIRHPEYLHALRADLERGPKFREDFITRSQETVRAVDSVVAWIGAEMEFTLSQAVASGDAFEHRPSECGHCVQDFLTDLDLRDLPGKAAGFELGADDTLPTADLRFDPAALVVPCGHLPGHAAVAADLGNMAIPNRRIPRRLRSDSLRSLAAV